MAFIHTTDRQHTHANIKPSTSHLQPYITTHTADSEKAPIQPHLSPSEGDTQPAHPTAHAQHTTPSPSRETDIPKAYTTTTPPGDAVNRRAVNTHSVHDSVRTALEYYTTSPTSPSPPRRKD